jgi:hypothetical protein
MPIDWTQMMSLFSRQGMGGTPGGYGRRGFPPMSPSTPPQNQDWNAAMAPMGAQEPPVGILNVDTNSGIPGWQSPSSDYAPNSFTTVRAPDNEQTRPPQPTIFGLSPERFALTAGVAANAIAPNSVGGRLGAGAAQIAAQDLRGQKAERLAQMNRRTGRSGAVKGGEFILVDENNPNSGWIGPPGVPPDTPMGHSRPAFGGYPAISGEWNPRQKELRGVAPGRTLLPENRDPNVSVTAPYAPMNTGPGHAATIFNPSGPPTLGPLVPPLPSQTGQSFPAGSTFRTGPDQPLQVATPTTSQNVEFGGPGTTPYIGQGQGKPPIPGLQTPTVPSQGARAQGVGRAAAGASGERAVLQAESTTLGRLDKTLSAAMKTETDDMQMEILRTRRVGVQKRLQQISRQLREMSGTRQAAPAVNDPLEGKTATGPNGQRIIRQNGQWVPYNGR